MISTTWFVLNSHVCYLTLTRVDCRLLDNMRGAHLLSMLALITAYTVHTATNNEQPHVESKQTDLTAANIGYVIFLVSVNLTYEGKGYE